MSKFLCSVGFELLALGCGAPPGGRSKTGRKAAGAQRPTPCEAEGRASLVYVLRDNEESRFIWYNGAKHSKAKCIEFGQFGAGLRPMRAEDQKLGPRDLQDRRVPFFK